MGEAVIRSILAPLEQVQPELVMHNGRALNETEFVELVFGTDTNWRYNLDGRDLDLRTSGPHWFVTDLELGIDHAWVDETAVRALAEQLSLLKVRTKLERLYESSAQSPTRYRLILNLHMIRRADSRPPRRNEHSPAAMVAEHDGRVEHCEHCAAAHLLCVFPKGNLDDSKTWTNEYCLECGRGVFTFAYYDLYLFQRLSEGEANEP